MRAKKAITIKKIDKRRPVRKRLARRFFPKLSHLKTVRRKIRSGEKVSIGVFCSGNGDRSPFAQAVLQRAFNEAGLSNVKVFSFGISAVQSQQQKKATERTAELAKSLGYPEMANHVRHALNEDAVLEKVKRADLLLGASNAHTTFLLEYDADAGEAGLRELAAKTWTMKGFANRTEWKAPAQGVKTVRLRRGVMRRTLAERDPYESKSQKEFEKILVGLQQDMLRAARRLGAKPKLQG